MNTPGPDRIRWLYHALQRTCADSPELAAYWGAHKGWPAEEPFEMVAGAVLVQNTAWGNAERALDNLKSADRLSIRGVLEAHESELTELVRPAGFHRTKAGYLRNVSRWLQDGGGFESLGRQSTGALWQGLLAVRGVGPETAECILLYVFARPVFVIDAYTRRLLKRLGIAGAELPHHVLRRSFESALPEDSAVFANLHAFVVAHAKAVCRAKPLCEACALRPDCVWGQARFA